MNTKLNSTIKRILILASLPLSSASFAASPNSATTANGNIEADGNNLTFMRYGPQTGGGETWVQNKNGNWSRKELAFSSFEDLNSVDLINNGHSEHVIGAEAGTLFYMSRKLGDTYYDHRKTLAGPKIKGSVGMTLNSDGDLVIIAPLVTGGLGTWEGHAYKREFKYKGAILSAQKFDNVSVLQAKYSGKLRLELVARQAGKLVHMVNDAGTWKQSSSRTINATGELEAIEGQGGIEIIAKVGPTKISHYQIDKKGSWSLIKSFGSSNYQGLSFAATSNNVRHAVAMLTNGSFHHFSWAASKQNAVPKPKVVSTNTKPAATGGISSVAPKRMGSVAIHTTLLPNGKVMTMGYSDFNPQTGVSSLYSVNGGAQATQQLNAKNLFCSGQSIMPNGEVLVVGGHIGPTSQMQHANIYSPYTNKWRSLDTMDFKRWYPTVTTIASGDMLIISGQQAAGRSGKMNPQIEFYTPGKSALSTSSKTIPQPFSKVLNWGDPASIFMYPVVYQLPSGDVAVHSGATTRLYDADKQTWSSKQFHNVLKVARSYPSQTAGVLLPLLPEKKYAAELMFFGSAGKNFLKNFKTDKVLPGSADVDTPAKNTVEYINLSSAAPKWKNMKPMSKARVLAKAVILPSDEIMVLGGSSKGLADEVRDPVDAVEAYNAKTGNWQQWNPISIPRLYHSTATLLPDATVLIAGTDRSFNKEPFKAPQRRAEVFQPPYLFNRGTRPIIAKVDAKVSYGVNESVTLSNDVNIKTIRLIKNGSSTHANDMSQRSIGLNFSQKGKTLLVKMPPDSKVAPPGHYMLFVMNDKGMPSVAKIINLSN